MKLAHLTATTGHLHSTSRMAVKPQPLAVMTAWLNTAIGNPEFQPLPAKDLGGYRCRVNAENGTLIATVYAPKAPGAEKVVPVITFSVAANAKASDEAWSLITHVHAALLSKGIGVPLPAQLPAPWCAVVVYPVREVLQASDWLGEFERTVAWAWIGMCERAAEARKHMN